MSITHSYTQSWTKYYKIILMLYCVNTGSCKLTCNKTQISNNVFNSMPKFKYHHPSSSISKDMKYILLWPVKGLLHSFFGKGQEVFIQNECRIDKCYVATNKFQFGCDLKKIDAIIFDEISQEFYRNDLPTKRYIHQKYVFMQIKSAARNYVCHTAYDNFFNWTITYKLNSDFIFPYIQFKDVNDEIVAPKKDVFWNNYMRGEVDSKFASVLKSKTKAAAWCETDSALSNTSRLFVKYLQEALDKYQLKIDILVKQDKWTTCDDVLNNNYFFYLALEDTFSEDYVTTRVVYALNKNMVPIVFGAADYRKFLPPGSYIDARTYSPKKLADTMNRAIQNPLKYSWYFRWKSYYTHCEGPASLNRPSTKENKSCGKTVCQLCEALHNPAKFKTYSVYSDFRKWWYPNYTNVCRGEKR